MQALWDAPLVSYPFPHFFAKNVFDPGFYGEILKRLPPAKEMKTYRAYPSRMDSEVVWPELEAMFDSAFHALVCKKFSVEGVRGQLRFIRDGNGYSITPHTDMARKVLSLLFYLPEDESLREYGTGIYVPKKEGFKDPNARHHAFEEFTEVWRAPFLPNTCFGFLRTDDSFHGVKPIGDVVRNTLLYNIYR